MSQPLLYVDTSDVRRGRPERLKRAVAELADFVEGNEPRLISYGVYFNEDAGQMTVLHVHADAASLDHHMNVASPRFGRFADLLELRSIHIYGQPSEAAVAQLRDKLGLLGAGELVVHTPHAGFRRFGVSDQRTSTDASLG